MSAKVRYGPVQLVLDVPDGDVLLAGAANPHKQQVASVVFFDANGGQPVETLRLPGAYCLRYHEQFSSSDVSGGAYQCTLTLSDPAGWTIQAGGPARAFVAPAARSYAGVAGASEAIGIGGVMGGAPAPVPPVPPAAWEAAAGPRVAISEEVAREWLLENAELLTAAATVMVARPAIEEATTAQTVTPNKLRPTTSAAMLLADGTILTASSQRRLPDDEMPANLLREVIEVLGTVPVKKRGKGHGKCAEPQIISQAIRDGKSLKGAKSLAMLVRPESHELFRVPICACTSCEVLLAHYQIIDVVIRLDEPSL